MNIVVEEQKGIQFIRINGRLDGTTMQIVEGEFLELVNKGSKFFVFDLSELEYISSAGLRVMLLSVKKTRAAGGKIALFGLNENVNEVFKISGFSTIFPIFQTEEEALKFAAS
ncbi:STAS domain-containing protein [Ammoniphilus resinae]|uniref:Anti-sigma factor antagonist n=1 Tax=Ammoniphilus resinae TaxID=861532 RepID=A0ABS4GQW0_9BACL|nr:STAS domain-containing protein [Ammoniphilus resinae]MBP1932275.1 anti-anti-sigma factor [Ammoniphilus resinae]